MYANNNANEAQPLSQEEVIQTRIESLFYGVESVVDVEGLLLFREGKTVEAWGDGEILGAPFYVGESLEGLEMWVTAKIMNYTGRTLPGLDL